MEHFVVTFRLFTFSVFYFHPSLGLYYDFFIQLHCPICSLALSPSPKTSPVHPKILHGSHNICPFFVFDVVSFYKHNMYRKSTQTNMFLFCISKYKFFLMSFKQSARASHIRTQCKVCHLLFNSTTSLV